jgi:hypothetical protein
MAIYTIARCVHAYSNHWRGWSCPGLVWAAGTGRDARASRDAHARVQDNCDMAVISILLVYSNHSVPRSHGACIRSDKGCPVRNQRSCMPSCTWYRQSSDPDFWLDQHLPVRTCTLINYRYYHRSIFLQFHRVSSILPQSAYFFLWYFLFICSLYEY